MLSKYGKPRVTYHNNMFGTTVFVDDGTDTLCMSVEDAKQFVADINNVLMEITKCGLE